MRGMFNLNLTEVVIIGLMAVLLFGQNLPKMARDLAKGFAELRNGMQGVEQKVLIGVLAALLAVFSALTIVEIIRLLTP